MLVEDGETTLVVDAGPDFRQQMLRAGVKNLDALLITHEHKDHLAGLDDVRAFNFLQKKHIPIYGLPRVLERIQVEYAYAFAEKKYPGVPQLDLYPATEAFFEFGSIKVWPIPVMHARLPVLGYRFGNFTYITDANHIGPEAREIIRGSDFLVLNALQKEPHISHFTLEEAIGVARELEVPNVYFTHMSHKMGRHKLIEKELPPGIQLAWDGLIIRTS